LITLFACSSVCNASFVDAYLMRQDDQHKGYVHKFTYDRFTSGVLSFCFLCRVFFG